MESVVSENITVCQFESVWIDQSDDKEDLTALDLTVHCEPTLSEQEDLLDDGFNERLALEEECVDPLDFLEVDHVSREDIIRDYEEGSNSEKLSLAETELLDNANNEFPENSSFTENDKASVTLTTDVKVEEDSQSLSESTPEKATPELPICEECGCVKRDQYTSDAETRPYCECPKDVVDCRICNKVIKNSLYPTHLRRHKNAKRVFSTHVPGKGFLCIICERPFRMLKTLRNHILTCKDKKYYKCLHCLETFPQKRLLLDHLKVDHKNKVEEETFNCEICCIVFDNSSSKKEHIMEVHVAAQRFVCSTCGEAFVTECAMKRHTLTHDRKFSCKVCGKEFGTRNALIIHRIQHQTIKDLTCKVCKKQFELISDYAEHKLTRCSVESTACDLCHKAFKCKASLRKHVLTHTPLSERSILCNLCNGSFSGPSALRKHVRLIHTDLRPYTCEFCSKSFTQLCKLKYHIVIHSSDKPVTCEICNKAFSNDKDIKIHMRTHTGERPFQCNVCGKSFRQRGHVTTHQIVHTKERPYVCELCDKRFGLPSSLNKHMKLHASKVVIPLR